MPPPLLTHIEPGIPVFCHEHVAVIYRGQGNAFRHASFLSEGLARGDECVYLAPPEYHAEMRSRMGSLAAQAKAGRLHVHAGATDFESLCEMCRDTFITAENAAVPALRWLEDGLWPAAAEFPMPHFFEFHALLNYQVKHYPSAALCQYDLERIPAPHLFQAIAVHRHLVVDGTLVRDNPFYIPAEKFIPLAPEDRGRDLRELFREVGNDWPRLLGALRNYGRLQGNSTK